MTSSGNDDTKAEPWDQHAQSASDSDARSPLFFVGALEYGRRQPDHIGEYAAL